MSDPVSDPDICVIGAGSAGLSVAAGASQMGANVVLIEGGEMGGDCLNFGCVPSKALIASAKAAHVHRKSPAFGVRYQPPDIDFPAVKGHVRQVIEAIAPVDSQERFEGLGVEVIRAHARFVSPHEVEAGDRKIRARRFVIATGSSPLVPPIPGLDSTPHHTNETIFPDETRPDHLIVVGGGPIGCEMAQAHARLGAKVTLVEAAKILPKDEPEAVDVVRQALLADGVTIREGVKVTRVAGRAGAVSVRMEEDHGEEEVTGSHLLLAVGRTPNLKGLGLDAADVEHDAKGIEVDRRMRTSQRHIYAIGDCRKGPQFTHIAGYEAGIVIQNILFRLPAKADYSALPWVTYTDPELAHVGMTMAEARKHYGDAAKLLTWSFEENDRAQAERRIEGKVGVVAVRGKPVGATIVGAHAGELIQAWCLAISTGLTLRKMASMIVPYPTLAEVNKRAAGSAFTEKLFGETTRTIVRFLARFG